MAKKLAFSPLGDRVLVKPADKGGEKKLASGIIIPESVDKDAIQAEFRDGVLRVILPKAKPKRGEAP